MARKGQQQIVFPVETAEEVDEWIEKSDSILVVPEVHRNWTDSILNYIVAGIVHLFAVFDLHKGWCGRCVVMDPALRRMGTVDMLYMGEREHVTSVLRVSMQVNTDILTEAQKETLPVNSGCKPSFAVLKHKVVIGRIQGANAPELNTIVMENAFPPPEMEA